MADDTTGSTVLTKNSVSRRSVLKGAAAAGLATAALHPKASRAFAVNYL